MATTAFQPVSRVELASEVRRMSLWMEQCAARLEYLLSFHEMLLTDARHRSVEAARLADLLDPPPSG